MHIDLNNKRIAYKPVNFNQQVVSYENRAKYPDMTLDVKLMRKPHVKKDYKEFNVLQMSEPNIIL